jgi:hypothetical protein
LVPSLGGRGEKVFEKQQEREREREREIKLLVGFIFVTVPISRKTQNR